MISSIDLNPETKALRAEYDALRKEYSERFQQKEYMISFEEDHIYALYMNLIGQKQYEVFVLDYDIAKLKLKQQYLQSYINRNEKPDMAKVETEIALQLNEYKKKIIEQQEMIKAANEYLKAPLLTDEQSKEIKELYHTLVKLYHPDLHPDLTEKELALFRKAQAAYKQCDLETLREMVRTIDLDKYDDMLDKKGIETNWQERVNKLHEQLDKIKSDIEQLEEKFPFIFRDKLSDKDWVKEQQTEISTVLEEKKKVKEGLLKIIDLMLS